MKLKLASLAAAVALSVSVGGAASSANAAGMGNALSGPAIQKSAQDSNIQKASYYGYGYHARRCARLRHLARMGSRWARMKYRRLCRYRYHSRYRMCRKLYVRGYVYGSPRARYMYRKYCRFHRVSFRYGY